MPAKAENHDPTAPSAFAKSMLRLPTFDLAQMRKTLALKLAAIDAELGKRGEATTTTLGAKT